MCTCCRPMTMARCQNAMRIKSGWRWVHVFSRHLAQHARETSLLLVCKSGPPLTAALSGLPCGSSRSVWVWSRLAVHLFCLSSGKAISGEPMEPELCFQKQLAVPKNHCHGASEFTMSPKDFASWPCSWPLRTLNSWPLPYLPGFVPRALLVESTYHVPSGIVGAPRKEASSLRRACSELIRMCR